MPTNLTRYQHLGHLHFITFSCHGRRPYLGSPLARTAFEISLETMRLRYQMDVIGYVVMPEHVHVLVSEPTKSALSRVIQALKLAVSIRQTERPFWLARYYDFNVYSERKRIEKLKYMHRNPVSRGLVNQPEEWSWSSFRHYSTGEQGRVEIASAWLQGWAAARDTHVSNARRGAPAPEPFPFAHP